MLCVVWWSVPGGACGSTHAARACAPVPVMGAQCAQEQERIRVAAARRSTAWARAAPPAGVHAPFVLMPW